MNIIQSGIIIVIFTFTACSENSTDKKSSTKKSHLWQAQTDALQKSKNLATKLNEEFKKKEQQMKDAQ